MVTFSAGISDMPGMLDFVGASDAGRFDSVDATVAGTYGIAWTSSWIPPHITNPPMFAQYV